MNKMIGEDWRRNKLTRLSILSFMVLCSFLFSLTCFLFSNLWDSVDHLMEIGQTPDFVQMHTGDIDEERLADFATQNQQVKDYQTLLFLNVDNSQIVLNEKNLADSSQDHVLVTQSRNFDYLLNLEDEMIDPKQGQVYLPVSYQRQYDLEVGQKARIVNQEFEIAGFLRDSQMTSMMASSKRFLISEDDMNHLLAKGEREYLIEFMLDDSTSIDSFVSAYHLANLPANGPTITKSLIRLVSGLSDGVMIVVVLFSSLALLLLAILCIRFVVLMTLEQDKQEIGFLKAIGYTSKAISKMYVTPYLLLSSVGALIGGLLTYGVQGAISKQTQILYGLSDKGVSHLLSGIVGCVLAESLILLSIRKTMKRVKRMNALSILLGKDEKQGQLESTKMRKRFGAVVVLVIGLCMMLVITPLNLWQTMSSPSFVTYMGIGQSDVRIDIRQSDTVVYDTEQLVKSIETNQEVDSFVSFMTYSIQVQLPNKEQTRLLVESGNHHQFPVSYIKGKAPQAKNDIAISYLYATDNQLKLGDKLRLSLEEGEVDYNICGIYSDITNGGKTAKVTKLTTPRQPTWSVLYLTVKINTENRVIQELEGQSQKLGIDSKIIGIQDYIENIYGSTLTVIERSSVIASSAAMLILFVVIYLFMWLILTLDVDDIALLKAIGLTSKSIKKQYIFHYLTLSWIGIVVGVSGSIVVGEFFVATILKSFGAVGFRFVINWQWIAGFIPLLFLVLIFVVIILAMSEINKIKAYKCFYGRG